MLLINRSFRQLPVDKSYYSQVALNKSYYRQVSLNQSKLHRH